MTDVRFINCETCHGEGRILTSDGGPDDKDHGACPECNGAGRVEVEVQPVALEDLSAGEPSTPEQIVGIIRSWRAQGFTVSRDEAIALIEQYAAIVASEAALTATSAAFDRCIAVTDAALSKPLVDRTSVKSEAA